MQRTDALVFIHKWVPAESVVSDPVTLLLLHGTERDENALLTVGKELWPGAALRDSWLRSAGTHSRLFRLNQGHVHEMFAQEPCL